MNNGLTEINDIITKHLPAQVGTVLQERLAFVDRLEQDFQKQSELLTQATKEKNELLRELTQAQSQLATHDVISARELSVEKREIRLELTVAQQEAKAAEDKANALYQLVGTIFRNPMVTETVIKNGSSSGNGYAANGNYVSNTESATTTRTIG